MVGAIIGGFTILGAFLTLAAWINGRTMKKFMASVIAATHKEPRELISKLITEIDKRHTELLQDMGKRHTEYFREILHRVTESH